MAITSNYALRLPASLKKAVEAVARGTTLNQFIVSAVAASPACARTSPGRQQRQLRDEPRTRQSGRARLGVQAFHDPPRQ